MVEVRRWLCQGKNRAPDLFFFLLFSKAPTKHRHGASCSRHAGQVGGCFGVWAALPMRTVLPGESGGDAEANQVVVPVARVCSGHAAAGGARGVSSCHVVRCPVLIVKGRPDKGVGRDALQGEVPLAADFEFADEQAGVASSTSPSGTGCTLVEAAPAAAAANALLSQRIEVRTLAKRLKFLQPMEWTPVNDEVRPAPSKRRADAAQPACKPPPA